MQTWKEITLDQWVNDTFIGAKIKTDKLTKVPCAGSTHHKNLSNIKKTHFKKETKRPMEQRVTKHVTEQESGYIPSIFLRENKNNKHVLILTLKQFKKRVIYRHFKTETLPNALQIMKKDCFMASINLADACWSILVAISDKKQSLFQLEEVRYKYVCLKNGLSSALMIFTKLLKPVSLTLRKESHQAMNYLDNFFFVWDTF